MLKTKQQLRRCRRLRRLSAALLAAAVLYGCYVTAASRSAADAAAALRRDRLVLALLRWELGDFGGDDALSLTTAMALGEAPVLLSAREEVLALWSRGAETETETGEEEQTPAESAPITAETPAETTPAEDNGVPARTMVPTSDHGYTVLGSAYVSNVTAHALDPAAFDGSFDAVLTEDAPQVLLIHTHGSEAYTMPAGQEYAATGDHRTSDPRYNVVRVGDEIADVLAGAGVSVVHDRTLYDSPQYNGAYGRALVSIRRYLEKYPSLRFVLDIHRDAVVDANGQQYKVISPEKEGGAAQMTLVMGSDGSGLTHPDWMQNLKLAVALQQTLLAEHPTLMRPILLRNSRYNQHATTGSLLVEVGAAGNSLDEALYAARLFAAGFLQTVRQK